MNILSNEEFVGGEGVSLGEFEGYNSFEFSNDGSGDAAGFGSHRENGRGEGYSACGFGMSQAIGWGDMESYEEYHHESQGGYN